MSDESGFNINMRPPEGWSVKGTPAVVEAPITKAISHTVLGVISAKFVIAMELREPQKSISKRLKVDFPKKRNRKVPADSKTPKSKGTVTGHYMSFLMKAMDEMDHFPEMMGYYIIMDNALIHTSQEISAMIAERGYRSVCLPPYSPELNPIEQFWAIDKTESIHGH
ncbi:hypothetical protein [Parasitella parasitica]|uniref:Tc1-like transposase DDE domain-containing protein n=1 Tax=Parasitella parasitica TaxID=35722 RepID=A0A0B7NQU4_9FUNG|nr:hypothetical protein [Parasitella parasitica]